MKFTKRMNGQMMTTLRVEFHFNEADIAAMKKIAENSGHGSKSVTSLRNYLKWTALENFWKSVDTAREYESGEDAL